VKDSVKVKVEQIHHDIEAIFLNVLNSSRSRTSSLLLGCVYRPPNTSVDFWSHLQDAVDDCMRRTPGTPTPILVGDFNVNILNPSGNSHFPHLNRFNTTLDISSIITTPTRVPNSSCLDLALLPNTLPDDLELVSSSVCSLDGLSDHHLIMLELHLHSFNPWRIKPHATTRTLRKLNREAYLTYVASYISENMPTESG